MHDVADGCQVDDPECTGRLTYPDLANAGTDGWHRFPVRRIFANLDLEQLIPGLSPHARRKCFDIGSAATVPLTSFIIELCQIWHTLVKSSEVEPFEHVRT